MIVKVGRVGGKVLEVALPGDATVADALKAAGITKTAQDSIYLNGTKRTDDIASCRAANSDLIIVEGKTLSFTPTVKRFCEILINEMADQGQELDIDESYNEDTGSYEPNYFEFFNDNKSMIISLITAAKEVV